VIFVTPGLFFIVTPNITWQLSCSLIRFQHLDRRVGAQLGKEVTSKVLDGVNDLVIMAPIRDGFINAYENMTYATRLRIMAQALNDIREAAREHEKQVPFADASERILSLLDFRVGIIDNDLFEIDPKLGLRAKRYLYLVATFDGVGEPYIRLIWRPLGPLLDLLFCNCEGYVFAGDNSFQDYAEWVRSAQVDSAVFFTSTGITVKDQYYLRKLERLQRESDPASADLSIARLTCPDPGEEAAKARGLDPMTANRLALEALGVLYRLSDFYPRLDPLYLSTTSGAASTIVPEHHLLLRATNCILRGWDFQPLLPALDTLVFGRFKPLVDWYRSGLSEIGEDVFPSTMLTRPDSQLDPGQVQQGLLKGVIARRGALLMMTVRESRPARKFVSALPINFEDNPKPGEDGMLRTLGITSQGLMRLGVKRSHVDAFPIEFREGMAARSSQLGDAWDNHPRAWTLIERNWPPLGQSVAPPRPPVEMGEIDFVIQLRHVAKADDGGVALMAEIAQLAKEAAAMDVDLVAYELMETLFDKPGGMIVDHFGLNDSISQPLAKPDAEPNFTKRVGSKRDDVPLGEILCGYGNDRGDYATDGNQDMLRTSKNPSLDAKAEDRKEATRIQRNGSYLVIRKLRQDVSAYRDFLEQADQKLHMIPAAENRKEALAARIIGRYPDGRSLIDPTAAEPNDFDYSGDAEGAKCPFASHIRRTNPRKVEHGRPPQRILRRGMSFGPSFETDPEAPRGLMFMAYNANIAEQFELIQRWINGGNSAGVASANNDPLVGVGPRPDGKRVYRFEVDGQVVRVDIPKPFVKLEWGLYLFVPSKDVLKEITESDNQYYPTREPLEDDGTDFLTRLEKLPRSVQREEWHRILEDFDTKDQSEGDFSPDVYAAIRFRMGGSFVVPPVIDKQSYFARQQPKLAVLAKEDGSDLGQNEDNQRIIISASYDHVMQALSDWNSFSVETQLRRLTRTSGKIFVSEQPDNVYDDTGLDTDYWTESSETNKILFNFDYPEGYDDGYAAGESVLAALIQDAEFRHAALKLPGKPEFKMEIRREYFSLALGKLNAAWFGLPDDVHMKVGDWDWSSASKRIPLCPGDCLSPSRHAFFPRSLPIAEALAVDHGQAIRKAGEQFVARYYNKGTPVPGKISAAMFAMPGADEELLARNLIGIMLGATPPMDGSLRGIIYDWLSERTLWRYQADLRRAAGDKRAKGNFAAAKMALLRPLSEAMCKRPSPDLLFRTAKAEATFEPDTAAKAKGVSDITVKKNDLIILSLASAAQWQLCKPNSPRALETGVSVIFGGYRTGVHSEANVPAGEPVHACPSQKLAMGAMMGIMAALLDVGRIQAQPAGLILRISDWR
jgi:deferrochelatase/peroxidase EfeB